MNRPIIRFIAVFIAVFAIDQAIKWLFLHGFSYQSAWIDLVLVFNRGVAFSWFAFLGEHLKYIQLVLVAGIMGYLLGQKEILRSSALALGLILGGGCSNILDRFMHGGVVDYIYWHKWFSFAVFNFADVMIDLGVVLLLITAFWRKK